MLMPPFLEIYMFLDCRTLVLLVSLERLPFVHTGNLVDVLVSDEGGRALVSDGVQTLRLAHEQILRVDCLAISFFDLSSNILRQEIFHSGWPLMQVLNLPLRQLHPAGQVDRLPG